MRIECPSCHAITDATVALTDQAQVRITCQACGHADPVALAAVAPPAAGSPTCPKCDAPRVEAGPCPRCGLAPEHADTWRARQTSAPTAALDAAWGACEASWADLDVHERAAAVALATRDYAWLAGRYRDRLRARGDDAIARAQLDKLARRAQAALAATAAVAAPARTARKFPVVAVVVAAVAVAATAIYASHLARTRESDTGRTRPVEPATDGRPRQLPEPTIVPAGPRR